MDSCTLKYQRGQELPPFTFSKKRLYNIAKRSNLDVKYSLSKNAIYSILKNNFFLIPKKEKEFVNIKQTPNLTIEPHHTIRKNYYTDLNIELRQKYKQFVGVDSKDQSYLNFTIEQQVERYAKNYAFWLLEEPKIDDLQTTTGKIFVKSYIVNNALSELRTRIDKMFDKDTQNKIYTLATKIVNNWMEQKVEDHI